MIIVLIGVAGAGKSKQCNLTEQKYGWKSLYTGALLRSSLNTEQVRKLTKGSLLPDEQVIPLIKKFLDGIKKNEHCLIDGFPRTKNQANWLRHYAEQRQMEIMVFHLIVSLETAEARLLKRGRADDHEAAIKERFGLFEKEIKPVIESLNKAVDVAFYEIDGEKTVENVFSQIEQKLPRR